MIFGQDRQALRRMYVDAWQKLQRGEPLSPLEAQIAEVVSQHPEYHDLLDPDRLDDAYTPEGGRTNPFLHMGLHLAVRDQVATDRPPGIAAVYRSIVDAADDAHAAEHRVLDCLAETLWEAQNRGAPPDEQAYLERLKGLAGL